MGNSHAVASSLPLSLTPPSLTYPSFSVRHILTQSAQQHRSLIATIARYKLYDCRNVVRLIDSHSVESHNLCSVVSHLYVVIERPRYDLRGYVEMVREEGREIGGLQMRRIVVGCCKGLQFLRNQGQEVTNLREDHICIDLQHGDVVAKIMNPYFLDEEYEEEQRSTVEEQLARILGRYMHQGIQAELRGLIGKLGEKRVTMSQVIDQLDPGPRKGRSGIKLLHGLKPQIKRDSLGTVISNSSSLMIDGDVSDRMFKDFYEHFDSDISEIHPDSTQNNESECIETQHAFPRKYLRSKAFKKTNASCNSTQWMSCKSICSEQRGEAVTREPSWRDNFVRAETDGFLLQSAKLVESFVGDK